MEIRRPEKFGGDLTVESYPDLEKLYGSGGIHPADLKKSAARYLNELLTPIREKLASSSKAGKLMDEIKSFKVTR